MEKKIISFIFFVFFHSTIFSQKIQVVDENEKPIFNVSFYKKDLSIGEFSNYNGEINLSIFNLTTPNKMYYFNFIIIFE